MTSIRQRLLVSLLGLWLAVWGAVALVTQERSAHEVDELLDAQLAQAAQVLRALGPATSPPPGLADPQTLSPIGHPYESRLSYQRWRDDRLVASLGAAPRTPLAAAMGFSDREIDGTRWRVFGLPTGVSGEVVFVAQSYAIRDELIGFLTVEALRPILWSLPVSLVLIWLAVSEGLRPLRRLARSIARRSPERLEPIDGEGVPVEIRPLIQALNVLMTRLDEALAAERRFAGDASHELRTPFAVIRTYAQVARRSQDPVEQASALENLMQGVDRATRMIGQLLTMARLQGESRHGGLGSSSLAQVAAREAADRQAAAESRSIALSVHPECEEPATVPLPAPVAGILVGNLIDNAIKFTPPGGKVLVRIRRAPGRLYLEVLDTGPGIPTQARGRVFERFYRLPGATEPGAGLGLAIVRRICDRYGLSIELLDGPDGVGLVARVGVPIPAGATAQPQTGLRR